ncbi:MAG: hypothetical protein SF070_15030 [Gemmatimonadota bacterium]|nr:hypothetical protein [Gemmatimonadota bacterium]
MRYSLLVLLSLATPLPAQHPVATVLAEYDRMAAREWWPGFTPRSIPLAIYDGQRTWLVRHPAPPAEFRPLSEIPGAFVVSGQHAAVRGNSRATIGSAETATLLWPAGNPDPVRLAGTLLHEAFHVHQGRARPAWFGNEAVFFTYPFTDTTAQALQRLETEAFRRALTRPGLSVCWASRALALRGERAARIGPDAIGYERGNDLNEGLATWVQWHATGAPLDSLIPAAGFGPGDVRLRAYAVGPAQAALLERHLPGWPDSLLADSALTVDRLLGRALEARSCRADFSRRERDSVAARAGREAAAITGERAAARQAFLARTGWTLTVTLPQAQPLWPERFDPWNLTPLAAGEALHLRHLKLSGDRGRMEVLNRAALTRPAGAHPLFNGLREVVVAGLPDRPSIVARGDTLVVEAPGVTGTFTGLVREETGTAVTLRPR